MQLDLVERVCAVYQVRRLIEQFLGWELKAGKCKKAGESLATS